ncbi:acyl-[acyl-carrier-protein]--UDP-N-acetylglucosamine O-acyltransferase [Rhodospirillum rubrum]|uniref:acyl-ACP--UDP-N-acetylglucosamine O-acyltransferase n=1 Tax=Rhodospirillum rubrum TaxID=1085 RepID=UPI001902F948|nr:acyl-ACP--UDP-N-acetylglucosamine O-acyltransferase [Rhodospirillum rubrum]MBK1663283.1 acyl-[acyl-carrier-protein]--UDP-N-acetylglucosamine O-acyltransferase [Rhodospirillum rubrum]MBK1675094.1 acyl-[acyl-carrier-protein]--UDP-N-acetylglucosamine O-acyltransferase [Rhodospirillum rubrum]
MPSIHPTAIVDPKADLGHSVSIGPYCLVGPEVVLGDGVELVSHVIVAGNTTIGASTRVFSFASLGTVPQDLKYHGEATRLVIGANNTIREHVTMNPGTEGGGGLTEVGANNLFMIGTHVAHDCKIGDGIVAANNVLMGGHVVVGDCAVLGGGSAIHQFVRIGNHAMVGGMSAVESDVIPFGSVIGNRAKLAGLNIVGMKRRGFARDEIHALRNAYKLLFAENVVAEQLETIEKTFPDSTVVREVVAFIRADSSRGLCRPTDGDAA